ncbi:SAM domain-containing protein SAMSN-1b [Kryptolebias marmoratus]|uniref:Uncharacterized LOC108249576 n=1 Tax=Kryptolebias marmoratus TaxID=37003 RepID=A0A3Q3BIY9_KRYMA|nr:SAM domain-containing protein SAMSN-1b [Kryptolebias marmoratus]
MLSTMNMFCFTLEGSTESIYEPANNRTLKDILPKYHCSPVRLRHRPEGGGSDPSSHTDQPKGTTKLKEETQRSCMPTLALDSEAFKKDINQTCWTSYGDKKGVHHQMTVENRSFCKSGVTGGTKVKELSPDRTSTDPPAQSDETAAESIQTTGRLKKLQKLVHIKKGHQSDGANVASTTNNYCLAEVVRNNNKVLTCIGLGKRTEMSSLKTTQLSQQPLQPNTGDLHGDSVEDGMWSPMPGHLLKPSDCPQAWPPFYHTCQQPSHNMWSCSGSLSLPRNSDWDRFETQIWELDSKQPDLSLPQMIRSITDLHLPQNTNRDTQRDEAEKRKTGIQKTFTKGHRKSRNSMESLYSLNSGKSSSSGVTSGSDCSSNRESLRLEDDLSFTRQFCCRARVHTEYMPSPYDTESLRLKVGDVIDVMAKPPLGIWTGMLHGRVGTFKFIYVDVLSEQSSESNMHKGRYKSTIQEVLKRHSLEAYSSALQLSGYQTVDDLMKLRECDLMELNVTNPEHRQQLLTAVNSLQQLHSDNHVENGASQVPESSSEEMKAELKNGPRDSGCLMTSDIPDSCTEDTDSPSEHPVLADMKVS